jgi:hypothetical protein
MLSPDGDGNFYEVEISLALSSGRFSSMLSPDGDGNGGCDFRYDTICSWFSSMLSPDGDGNLQQPIGYLIRLAQVQLNAFP